MGDATAVADVVRSVRPDVIVHAAAHGGSSWQTSLTEMVAVNVVGTNALVEAAAETGVEYVVALGSSSEYGVVPRAAHETDRLAPNSSYATTKAAGTHIVGEAIRAGRVRGVVLRLYSVYGPYEDPRRLMPTVAWWAARGALPPKLVSPTVARDFVHVADVCRAVDMCVDRAPVLAEPAVLNIGSGTQTTLADLVELVCREFGIEQQPAWGSMPDRSWDTDSWRAAIDRARDDLGWTPEVSLSDGVRELVGFVTADPGRYRPDETDTT